MSKKEYEIYQDKNGNVYNLTTELEYLLTNDIEEALDKIIELMEENTKLQNIIKEVREYIEHKIEECYNQGSTIGEFYKICDIDNKLKEILDKENI